MEEELKTCKEELARVNSEFDELLASSKEIEDEQALQIKELQEQLADVDSELEKKTKSLKKESILLKDKFEETQKKLTETTMALESTRGQLRDLKELMEDESRKQKDRIVSLESEVTSLQESLRVAEAAGERYKQRYETLLETSAMANCELDELRLKVKEIEQRKKVEMAEKDDEPTNIDGASSPSPSSSSNDEEVARLRKELVRVEKESTFMQQLLREVLSALSKGSVNIPPADQILKEMEKGNEK